MTVGTKRLKMMNREPSVELAGITMLMTNSGFAVTCVRNGSMENVLRLHLQRLSISSSTSAQDAVTKGPEFENLGF